MMRNFVDRQSVDVTGSFRIHTWFVQQKINSILIAYRKYTSSDPSSEVDFGAIWIRRRYKYVHAQIQCSSWTKLIYLKQ